MCSLNIVQYTFLEQMCFKKYLIGQISLQHLEGNADIHVYWLIPSQYVLYVF